MVLVKFWIFRQIYTGLCYFILPFVFLRLYLKGHKIRGYRYRWRERVASYSSCFKKEPLFSSPLLWVHAVSVGEVLAAIPLIKQLESRFPKQVILITTMTPTGSERVLHTFQAQLRDKTILHVYLPYDLPSFIHRFMAYFKPQCCLIMETEIWPNLFWRAIQKKIPIFIVNARLSPRSYQSYFKLKQWLQPLFTNIFVLAQSEADLSRYQALGVLPEYSKNMGNLKFDVSLPENIEEKTKKLRQKFSNRLIWIAASTHAQEEIMVLAAFRTLKKHYPELLLILVPRHPNRFDEVAQLCLERDWSLERKSQEASTASHNPNVDIYLGDTMGELLWMYAVSHVAFVGGSLVPVGGHNLLEPALFGVPALTGSSLHNFMHISSLLIEAKHTEIVNNAEDLAQKLDLLLKDKAYREQKGQAGKSVLNQNRGALNKLMDFVTHNIT